MKKYLPALALLGLVATAPLASAQTFAATGTTNVSLTVGAAAVLAVNTATTTLTSSGSFSSFTGSTSLTYKVRTGQASGTGSITALVTTDFAPSGGPVAGDLTYTCTVASPGTACSGSQTGSTSTATSVATFGADAHSANAGNSASLSWTLPDSTAYKTGSYTATVTFTVSAT